MSEYKYIGKPVRRVDGVAKVTGRACFSDDVILPRTYYAKELHARYAHAKILKLDTSRAKALPGVIGVFTAKDIPMNRKYLGAIGDAWLFAENYVRFIGDVVAAVVAVDEKTAEEALAYIDVEYEQLPIVASLQDAYAAENLTRNDKPGNVAMPLIVERGNTDSDFAGADVVVGGHFVFPSLHQLHLEPNSATAVYNQGKLTVYCASQVWFHIREDISAVTGVPEKDIEIKAQMIGGAFGARNDQPMPAVAALLACLVKGTVKMTNTRLEEFLACRPSLGMEFDLSIAADKEGHFISKKMKLLSDFGAYSSDSDAVTAIACFRADNNYTFKSTYVEGNGLYTNHTPTGAYRGFGNPQMHFALEQTIDMLAKKLQMDPTELRMKNYHKAGDTSIHGFKYATNGIAECMQKAKELMDWDKKRAEKKPGRGLGVASLIHCSGSKAGKYEFSGTSALLRLESSGNLTLLVGESEIGQGISTGLVQLVSEELGVDPSQIKIVMGDTALTPFSTGTNGSKLMSSLGSAAVSAAKNLKEQILNNHCGILHCEVRNGAVYGSFTDQKIMSLDEAAKKCSYTRNGSPIVGFGMFEPTWTDYGDKTGYGNLAPSYPFGVQMAEVSVDEYGNYKVEKLVSVHDIGRVINTQMAAGQVYGGVVQGFGSATTENLSINAEGVYQANTILEYKPATALDIPPIHMAFVETVDPYGPFGAKCIAEPPIISIAPAIANALYDATGIRFDQVPITPAVVCKKIMEKQTEELKREREASARKEEANG